MFIMMIIFFNYNPPGRRRPRIGVDEEKFMEERHNGASRVAREKAPL